MLPDQAVATLQFRDNNDAMAASFRPSRGLCGGGLEVDDAQQLFRVRYDYDLQREYGEVYSPILALSAVTGFYLLEHYREEADNDGDKTTKYVRSDICIETQNMFVPFVEMGLPRVKAGFFQSAPKLYRQEAESAIGELMNVFRIQAGGIRTVKDN